MHMNTPHPPLETVVDILKMINLEVTHQHEDLVFVSGNQFLLLLTEDKAHIDLYFNETTEEEKAREIMAQMKAIGELLAVTIAYKGAYSMTEDGDDSLSVELFDLTDS